MIKYLAAALLPACAVASAAPPETPFPARVDGQLAARSGNLIYSPVSIELALAMTAEGARGVTLTEMQHALGSTTTDSAVALLQALTATTDKTNPDAPRLDIANKLFLDSATPFVPAFVELTKTKYAAAAERLDFRNHPGDARTTINTWVATATHDKIKDLLPEKVITKDTRITLANAIYLKARWAKPFDVNATAPASFTVAGAAAKPVPTMHVTTTATWGDHGGARTLDLPYATGGGPALAMLLVVPDKQPLAAVEKTYDREGLAPFLTATTTAGQAVIALPKFEAGTTIDLVPVLKKLGILRAFTAAADFSGITTSLQDRITLSAVIHKAWAKVDEAGIEAAAATAVVGIRTMAVRRMDPPHPFNVDRSFLFYIHDDKGNVLFAGRIIDPAAAM